MTPSLFVNNGIETASIKDWLFRND